METKPWYLSKGIWGSLLVTAAFLLRLLGQEDVAATVEAESAGISEWIMQGMVLVGGALAFWGRVTAKKEITT